MIERGSGVIVHVASIQRTLPLYDSTLGYAAAKAALVNYSKGLSNEVSPNGVRVVTVSPGFIETDAATRMIERMATGAGSDYATARQRLMDMLGGIPLGRPNRPEEWRSWSRSWPPTGPPRSRAPSSSSTAGRFPPCDGGEERTRRSREEIVAKSRRTAWGSVTAPASA
jgi:NAD(P)-dependent dehydrogenase (short-subunit alcohol dehydrogenase family)